jgi:hypothetical protein
MTWKNQDYTTENSQVTEVANGPVQEFRRHTSKDGNTYQKILSN